MNRIQHKSLKSILIAGAATAALVMGTPSAMAAEKITFEISEQSLASALNAYGVTADAQVLYSRKVVAGKTSGGVIGDYEPEAALEKLLSGTGLAWRQTASDVFLVGDPRDKEFASAEQSPLIRVAQVEQEDSGRVDTVSDRRASADDEDAQDVVVVTGTRIKGVKDQFSPVTQIGREDMDLAGYSNVAEAIDSLPQNFGGGVTSDTFVGGAASGPGNETVNLRGLGNEATLVLINGRRVAPGGSAGSFIDISAIPASAIDRVEVLTDGASAIYGSDAVAGVVNIILRDDFNGAESRLHVGTITDGGGDYFKAAQTFGWTGDRAHALVTYEFSDEEELNANQKEFADNAIDPSWLLPFSQKHSLFASTGVKLTERITLSADGFFNDRKSKGITTTNITGLTSRFTRADVQQYGAALGLNVQLASDWEADLSGNYSKSDLFTYNEVTNLGISDDRTAVTEILAVDGTIGGPLFSITSDPVRIVIGGHYRNEKADLMRVSSTSGVLTDVDKSRNVYATFGELYAPLVSESDEIPGIESLALSAAVRYEDYSDVGSSLDPKVGLAWSPVSGLNIRGTYGTSFRAARLDQLIDTVTAANLGIYADPLAPDGMSVALVLLGTRDDVAPEQSRTWTVGFDFSPDAFEGFLLRGTYFNTEYRDRLGFPTQVYNSNFWFSDFTGTPIRDVTPQTGPDFCARAIQCFNFADFFPSFGMLAFEDVEVILDQRQTNLSFSKVAGFDLEASYDLASSIGDWRFSLGGTRLTTFEQQAAPSLPPDDLLNTIGNPVKLRMRGGAQLRSGSITTSVFVNHTGKYIDDEVPAGDFQIDAFTTVDASIRFDLDELADSPLTNGASLSFSVINMFNEDPPEIGDVPLRDFNVFDGTNSNPAGRKIGLLLTKRW